VKVGLEKQIAWRKPSVVATERDTKYLSECLCGKGNVEETFWANDHAFASDYSWHSEGINLNCDICEATWSVTESVANPTVPPQGKRIVYFVLKSELFQITTHNGKVEAELTRLWAEQNKLDKFLADKVRSVRKELLSLAQSDSRFEARFKLVGSVLEFSDVDSFRSKVGKTQPKTYIPSLVTKHTLNDIFNRMNRIDELETLKNTENNLALIAANTTSVAATKRLPTASEYKVC
jgi:hypothetical protein